MNQQENAMEYRQEPRATDREKLQVAYRYRCLYEVEPYISALDTILSRLDTLSLRHNTLHTSHTNNDQKAFSKALLLMRQMARDGGIHTIVSNIIPEHECDEKKAIMNFVAAVRTILTKIAAVSELCGPGKRLTPKQRMERHVEIQQYFERVRDDIELLQSQVNEYTDIQKKKYASMQNLMAANLSAVPSYGQEAQAQPNISRNVPSTDFLQTAGPDSRTQPALGWSPPTHHQSLDSGPQELLGLPSGGSSGLGRGQQAGPTSRTAGFQQQKQQPTMNPASSDSEEEGGRHRRGRGQRIPMPRRRDSDDDDDDDYDADDYNQKFASELLAYNPNNPLAGLDDPPPTKTTRGRPFQPHAGVKDHHHQATLGSQLGGMHRSRGAGQSRPPSENPRGGYSGSRERSGPGQGTASMMGRDGGRGRGGGGGAGYGHPPHEGAPRIGQQAAHRTDMPPSLPSLLQLGLYGQEAETPPVTSPDMRTRHLDGGFGQAAGYATAKLPPPSFLNDSDSDEPSASRSQNRHVHREHVQGGQAQSLSYQQQRPTGMPQRGAPGGGSSPTQSQKGDPLKLPSIRQGQWIGGPVVPLGCLLLWSHRQKALFLGRTSPLQLVEATKHRRMTSPQNAMGPHLQKRRSDVAAAKEDNS